MRILLIEDEDLLARNITRALQRVGAEVHHVASAAAGRAALADGGHDLIIADVSLGDGDGLALLAESADLIVQTPVIVMTGQDSVLNRSRAEALSVAAFLVKPFALSRLFELVAGLLRSKGQSGQRAAGRRHAPSVVMYSHDTIGLGHMRRNSALARELVAHVPGISVLMLVGCPAGMMFEPHPGIDYVKLPSLTKLGRGLYEPGALRIDAATTREMRMRIIEGVIGSIRPDLFLVDHEPAGAMDELQPVLQRLRNDSGVRTVLGLRDILDDPARTCALWAEQGTDKLIADVYDRVLVYGDESFFPSMTAYGLEALAPGEVSACGIVTTARARSTPIRAGRPERVLVSGGGGRDAFPMISSAIAAMAEIPSFKRPRMTVVTGPLMDRELQTEAMRLGQIHGVEVLEHVAELPELMAQSDLLITMTGYNSINEALAVGCHVVTVPRLGPSAEQRLRAEALERLGLARYLRREDLNPRRIARLLLDPPPPASTYRLDMNGVRNAARILASLCTAVPPTELEHTHA